MFKGRVYAASDLDKPVKDCVADIKVFDKDLVEIEHRYLELKSMKKGPVSAYLGDFVWHVPKNMPDQTALVCVTLHGKTNNILSRSVYPI